MEKEFTLKSELVRDDVDRQMVYLVRRFTDLSDEDMGDFAGDGALPAICGESGKRRYLY